MLDRNEFFEDAALRTFCRNFQSKTSFLIAVNYVDIGWDAGKQRFSTRFLEYLELEEKVCGCHEHLSKAAEKHLDI